MTASATRTEPVPGASRFSALTNAQKSAALDASREVTDSLYPGLDLSEEIAIVDAQGLGDTALLERGSGLAGFAICHYGPRSEAGADTCFIKFGAVRASPSAEQDYGRLLDACEALAVSVGMSTMLAGANLARHEAYQTLVGRGFRSSATNRGTAGRGFTLLTTGADRKINHCGEQPCPNPPRPCLSG
jgi:hypothetical protein